MSLCRGCGGQELGSSGAAIARATTQKLERTDKLEGAKGTPDRQGAATWRALHGRAVCGWWLRSAAATGQALRVEGSTIVPVHVERDLAIDAGEWRVVVQRLAAYPLQLVDATRSPLAGWWASVDGDDFAQLLAKWGPCN